MFIPNSPRPPRGIAVSVCVGLLKEFLSPSPNLKSYHTACSCTVRPMTQSPLYVRSGLVLAKPVYTQMRSSSIQSAVVLPPVALLGSKFDGKDHL